MLKFSHRCKEQLMINGNIGKVKYVEGKIVFITCNNSMLVPVFPVYSNRMAYYPVLPGFASTVQKVMGQDLPHMTLVFDIKNMSPAAGCCFVKSSVS